jgi:hypothetical protein
MSDKRTKYSEETQRKAVEEFNSGKKPPQQLADELGYKDTTRFYNWKAQNYKFTSSASINTAYYRCDHFQTAVKDCNGKDKSPTLY